MDYLKRAKEIAGEIIQNRRHIHSTPELGMETEKTANFVEQKLREMGYSPIRCAGTGVVATVGKPGGKVILLRADMDALPLFEDSGLDFSSQIPGAAHCCGHDLHTAMLLGTAKLLKENEENLPGTVKLMFQPGEEIVTGARKMIEDGLMENPPVDAAFGIHVNALYPPGKFLLFDGVMTSASNSFTIKIQGHAGHGARPEESIDPINAACQIYNGLQMIKARELSCEEHAVLSICSIHAGTSASNAIPDTAEMKGSLRTSSVTVRDKIIKRMEEISSNIAEAFHASAQVVLSDRYTVPLLCDSNLVKNTKSSIDNLLGEGNAMIMNKTNTASEDFSFIAQKVPSAFIILGAACSAEVKYGQHHPKVLYNENCLPIGAAVNASVATQWLIDNN